LENIKELRLLSFFKTGILSFSFQLIFIIVVEKINLRVKHFILSFVAENSHYENKNTAFYYLWGIWGLRNLRYQFNQIAFAKY
jgi:hypothetical protein